MSSPDHHYLHARAKFKHYRILWNIQNFFVQCCQKHSELCSPEVDGPQGTKLMLTLKCAPNEDGTFSLLLRRSAFDSGPETVWVNFHLDVASSYVHLKYAEKHRLYSFNKGTERVTNFTGMDFLFRKRTDFMPDHFFIESKMIIYVEDENTGLEQCADILLESLSRDMLALYESSHAYDVELKTGFSVLQAHKSILCSRCEAFNFLIDSHEICPTVDLTGYIDFEALRKVLAVIYTGDLKYVLQKPSLAIEELAHRFDIPNIKAYYNNCETLNFTSMFDSQEFIFKWSIRDFNSILENNKHLQSPVFTDYDSNRTWRLYFWSRSHSNEDYVAISVETGEKIKSTNLWLEISAVDEDENLTLINLLQGRLDGSKIIDLTELAHKNWLKSRAINDVLNLAIKIKLSTGRQSSEIERHFIPSVFVYYPKMSYTKLSFEMIELFKKSAFYDGVFQTTDGSVLLVHKCILAARCKHLYDMLTRSDPKKAVVILDINLDILSVVLTYIYCGFIPAITDDNKISQIVKAANDFKFPRLIEFCTKLVDNSRRLRGV